jgi:hypothetical protein
MIGFRNRPYFRRGMVLGWVGNRGGFIKLTKRRVRGRGAVDLLWDLAPGRP